MSNKAVKEIVEENEAALREYANKDMELSGLAAALLRSQESVSNDSNVNSESSMIA